MIRESVEFDVLIVGAGPAGLCAAIQLGRLSQEHNKQLRICVLEKGSQVGSHILSGAVMDPSALDALIPDWRKEAPKTVPVTQDYFYYLTQKKSYRLPVPHLLQNQGNEMISLGELCQWLAAYAEKLGVTIFSGFAANQWLLSDDRQRMIGVQTGDVGLDPHNKPTDRYQPGVNILAKQTVIAEGCRGSLSEQIIKHFNLRENADPQSYAIGVKELWKIPKNKHEEGKVIHTVGWPLDNNTYGGGFIYHFKDQLLSLGLIVGLDYQDPYLDPFQELQQLKRHPSLRSLLEKGECLGYGARALNEGGFQSIPKLTFPGGLLVGCAAGMLNVGRLKGIHNAIHSGRLAAQSIFDNIQETEVKPYQIAFKKSPIYHELYRVRNLRPGFHKGLWNGLCYAGIDQYIFKGKAPWTFHFKPDYLQLKPAAAFSPKCYPKPDNQITFDKLTQVFLTGTRHREDEPCHLILKNESLAVKVNLEQYAGPETRYCPAAVYEYVKEPDGMRLQINAANCIHCKTCDIKDPLQNIIWQPPEGGDGPNYHGL